MNFNIQKYSHVIWDWNGTLFNDVELCADIMNKLLISESLPKISIEHYKNIFTFPVIEYYKIAGHKFQNRSFEELGKEFMILYEQNKSYCNLYLSTSKLLQTVKSYAIHQHILSAYEQNSLNMILEEHNLINYFTNIIGLDNIYAGGKMELAGKLKEKIGLNGDGKNVLLIGDTIHDFEVAEENKWDCILIADGHQSKEKLLTTNTLVLDNLNKLENLFIKQDISWEL